MEFTQTRVRDAIPVMTERRGATNCYMALGYSKRTQTDVDWTFRLFTSQEVSMKCIHLKLSNLIGQV